MTCERVGRPCKATHTLIKQLTRLQAERNRLLFVRFHRLATLVSRCPFGRMLHGIDGGLAKQRRPADGFQVGDPSLRVNNKLQHNGTLYFFSDGALRIYKIGLQEFYPAPLPSGKIGFHFHFCERGIKVGKRVAQGDDSCREPTCLPGKTRCANA